MTYQVLARKYRPQRFEDVVGQEPVVRTLTNALASGRIHHAYVFSGIRGIGKTTSARLLAKALNCVSGPTALPCGACPACLEITAGRSLDAIEVDAASNRGIDEIRGLIQTAQYTPARDRYKVFIIDEFHMLTKEAFNALLKTLEEPPPHVVFILATTELEKVPATILSRCLLLQFRPVGTVELREHLLELSRREGVTIDAGAADLIARKAGGSLRDAHSTLDRVIALSGTEISREVAAEVLGACDARVLRSLLRATLEGDAAAALGTIGEVVRGGADLQAFVEDLLAEARGVLLAKVLGSRAVETLGVPEADMAELTELAALGSAEDCQRIVDRLIEAGPRLRQAAEPRFHLEALAVRLAHLVHLEPLADLARRLADGLPEAVAPVVTRTAPALSPTAPPAAPAATRIAPAKDAAPASGGWRERAASLPLEASAPSEPPPLGPPRTAEPLRGKAAPAAKAAISPLEAFSTGLSARLRSLVAHGALQMHEDGLLLRLPPDRASSREALEDQRFHLMAAAAAAFGRPVPVTIEAEPDLVVAAPAVGEMEGDELAGRRRERLASADPAVQAVVARFEGKVSGLTRPGETDSDEA